MSAMGVNEPRGKCLREPSSSVEEPSSDSSSPTVSNLGFQPPMLKPTLTEGPSATASSSSCVNAEEEVYQIVEHKIKKATANTKVAMAMMVTMMRSRSFLSMVRPSIGGLCLAIFRAAEPVSQHPDGINADV